MLEFKLIHVSKNSPMKYKQNKTKHNKTMCIFYGVYSIGHDIKLISLIPLSTSSSSEK